jgi:hypothetical protein
VSDEHLVSVGTGADVDRGAILVSGVGGENVHRSGAEPDVLSLSRGLALRHLGHELDGVRAEVGTHAQPLVDDAQAVP